MPIRPFPTRAGCLLAMVVVLTASCAGTPVTGADPLRPETFELSLVGGSSLPAFAYSTSFGGQVWIRSARLKSTEPGRTVDPRIFDDRSGNGAPGGDTRDSSTATARMADIRVFEERLGSTVVATRTDTSDVTVERRGAMLLIRREHPDPRRTVVDTGFYDQGIMRVFVREWERLQGRPANNVLFIYAITR